MIKIEALMIACLLGLVSGQYMDVSRYFTPDGQPKIDLSPLYRHNLPRGGNTGGVVAQYAADLAKIRASSLGEQYFGARNGVQYSPGYNTNNHQQVGSQQYNGASQYSGGQSYNAQQLYSGQQKYGREYTEPANYEFSYDVSSPEYYLEFGHAERRQGDAAEGRYYVLLPDGRRQVVKYVADQYGYRPTVSYENSGYQSSQPSNYQNQINRQRNPNNRAGQTNYQVSTANYPAQNYQLNGSYQPVQRYSASPSAY